jgi:hypothetical protein
MAIGLVKFLKYTGGRMIIVKMEGISYLRMNPLVEMRPSICRDRKEKFKKIYF